MASGILGLVRANLGEILRGDPLRRTSATRLGVGTLASYGMPGRHLTFYEIDPAMVTLARDPSLSRISLVPRPRSKSGWLTVGSALPPIRVGTICS